MKTLALSRVLSTGSLAALVSLIGVVTLPGCATTQVAAPVGAAQGILASTPLVAPSGSILFVLSAAGEQTLTNGKQRPAGFFLGELFEAYRAAREAGYAVVFATPGGRQPIIDPESLKASYWKKHPEWLGEAQTLVASSESLQRPLSLADARAREQTFVGLVVPGGQGVMVDLLDDKDLHAVLRSFGETSRPVGLICHAPALLTRLPADTNPFRGRAATSVSGFEEFFIETFIMGGRAKRRGIGAQLARQGFDYSSAFPGRPFAVGGCGLVTSQNPYSGDAFNARYLEAMEAYINGERCGGQPLIR